MRNIRWQQQLTFGIGFAPLYWHLGIHISEKVKIENTAEKGICIEEGCWFVCVVAIGPVQFRIGALLL